MTSTTTNQPGSLLRLKAHLRLPVITAPMFLVSNPALVIEACRSGVIGSFPAPNARTIEELDSWFSIITTALERARQNQELPAAWSVNMITHQSYDRFEEELALIEKYKPDLVITALGGPERVVETVHAYEGLVFADVTNIEYARKAVQKGADGLILICAGAGGHTGTYSHFAFIEEVRNFFSGPVALSGTLSNGRAVRAAEILGADFACVGTPFIATTESMAAELHKQMVVKKNIDDLMSSKAVTGVLGNWLKESLVDSGIDLSNPLAESKANFSGSMRGNKAWKRVFNAGQALGQVKEIKPVSAVVSNLAFEYEQCLRKECRSAADKLHTINNDSGTARPAAHRPDFSCPLEMFWFAVDTFPDTVALIQNGKEITYRQYGQSVISFSRVILEKISAFQAGFKGRKPKIGIYLPGSIDTAVSLMAVWNTDSIASMHNGLLSSWDVIKQFELASIDLIITSPELRASINAITGRYHDSIIETSFIRYDQSAPEHLSPDVFHIKARQQDVIMLLYSGGTTGTSKVVEHTRRSVISSVKGMEHAWPTRLNEEIWVSVSPMSHIYGLLFSLLDPIYSCSTNVLVYPFRSLAVVEALNRYKATVYSGGPPAMYSALLKHGGKTSYTSLRICGGGGAPFPVELLKKLDQELGILVTEAYGMTEMAPITCHDPAKGFRAGSVGKAGLSVEIKISDVETGKFASKCKSGVIWVKGNQQMKGYYNNPGATQQIITDGWMNTGDVGYLDQEGFLFITGRVKEMINVSGYKVFPREVDEQIAEFPGVTESCTFAIKDPVRGEAVCTVLTVENRERFDIGVLKEFLEQTLTVYKRPSYIEIVDNIPRTTANKQDRLTLQLTFEQKRSNHMN